MPVAGAPLLVGDRDDLYDLLVELTIDNAVRELAKDVASSTSFELRPEARCLFDQIKTPLELAQEGFGSL